MKKLAPVRLAVFFLLLAGCALRPAAAQSVLIVQDERPQMEALAEFLQAEGGVEATIVGQEALPDDLSAYDAVLLYIHGDLAADTERRSIDYTRGGGRLVVLHHSISSGKAANTHWFDFLGIRLDNPEHSSEPVEPGAGYGWRHDVTLTLVNLNAGHYITSHDVDWTETVAYTSSDAPSVEAEYPALALEDSEVYLNHKYTDARAKTVLLGMKYHDDRVDALFMQDRAAWTKRQGEGEIVYFMPGHTTADFEDPNMAQMILNSITWQR